MRIGALSDMHGDLPYIEDCDVLCICGDTVPLELQWVPDKCYNWLIGTFFDWIEGLPCKKVLWIAGNHDQELQNLGKEAIRTAIRESNLANKLIYLEDDAIEIDGVNFYGTPWVQGLNKDRWSFIDEGEHFKIIPYCDILLTHAAPYTRAGIGGYKNFGSQQLLDKMLERGVTINLCGHIHDGEKGPEHIDFLSIYNVSIKNDWYEQVYPVTYFYYGKRKINSFTRPSV